MKDEGLSRRAFCLAGLGGATLALSGCMSVDFPSAGDLGFRNFGLGMQPVPQLGPSTEEFRVPPVDMSMIPREFHRQYVSHSGRAPVGSIVVDTAGRHLYLITERDRAIRYGIGVGREGFSWSGEARVGMKAKWPRWTPPPEMVAREPRLRPYADGMPGGPGNPLGARAMYLFQGKVDTQYRIHGTNEPLSIGKAMSSGCIRMLNRDVIDLYERVPLGTKVQVVQGGGGAVV